MLMFQAIERRAGRVVAGVALLCTFLFGLTLVAGDPPPEPTGVCCIGNGLVTYGVTQAVCQVNDSGHVWIQGNFDPTDDVTPCDLLPGGD